MRVINYSLIFLVLVLFSSCEKNNLGDCFKSTGEITEEVREIESFTKIIIHDNVEIVLTPSTSNLLTVSAGKNLIDKIITEQIADTLIISNNNSCNWVRNYSTPIKVLVPINGLSEIEYRSIGDIICTDTIFSDSLNINVREGAGTLNILTNSYLVRSNLHYGTADIKVSGRCHLSYVYSASFGLIDNRFLISNQVYVGNKSSNDIYVTAVSTIAATIEGIGNIYYFGNPPNYSFNQIGSGQLIKLSQ